MTDRETLREKVARKVCASANAFPCNKAKPICASCLEDADVFIKLVMEEAAKIASEWKVSITGVEPISNKHASRIASSVGPHIAAALRAYITDPGTAS